MGEECITMSYREMDRLELLQALMGKQLRQREVAERLSLSVRQVKRVVARYRAEGLWLAKRRKAARIHQRRPQRPYLVELVQIEGSPHDWFEERGSRCTLIIFIDDATSRLMALHFVPAETTQAYMETLQA
ncbi:helix-turn-helix domain-containing protein, partial [Acidithiobacillus sp.]|uniref:helix-turn-helix domain-containing protein n=1 Tax=Acidithiobacillus sp. TaxID=1872118 RepID=UPI0032AFB503